MPQLESNNKGQLVGGASFNYTDFTEFYPCGGTGVLVGENGNDLGEQGAVPLTTGIFGEARGPCSGNFPAAVGFQSSFGNGSAYDTRVSAGFQRCAQIGWFNLSNNTNDQEFSSQARASGLANTRQWMLRIVSQDFGGPGNDGTTLFLWNHATGTNFEIGAFARASAGAFPLSTWCMVGWSVDLVENEARLFLGVRGEGTYYDVRSINASWNVFQSANTDVIMVGAGSGFSTGGPEGLVEHVTWWNGRSLVEADFLNHWNNGNGLARDKYLTLGGGATVHNAHGQAGNAHGGGGNR